MFSTTSFSLLSFFAFIGIAGANPIAQRGTCKPNFQGGAQTIYHNAAVNSFVNEWTPSFYVGGPVTLTKTEAHQAFGTGEFYVAFTGQPTNTYTFKLVADTNRQFALSGANGNLGFQIVTYNFPSPQAFSIDCNSCPNAGQGNVFALGCVIRNPSTGKCVTGSSAGATLTLETCNGSDAQSYNFRG